MASALTFATLPEAFQYVRDLDASINERLQIYADAVRALAPPYAAAVDRLVERLASSQAGLSAPRPGDAMPGFILPDETGRLVNLKGLLAAGPVALSFHRGRWCPFCRLNTAALADAQARLARGQIVAITPDRQQFAAALKAQANADFPVLTDMDNGYAMSLNLAIQVDDDVKRELLGFDIDISASQGNDAWMLPIPATFVVRSDGIVAARWLDPDFRRRMDIDDLLDAMNAAP